MRLFIPSVSFAISVLLSFHSQAQNETLLIDDIQNSPPLAVQDILQNEIKPLARSSDLIKAIRQQNVANIGLNQKQIIALDQKWRQETEKLDHPFIDQLLNNAASKQLQLLKNNKNGLITEIIVTDNKGLNVAISDITSDYWQGDEDKWQKTLPVGPDAVFISDPDIDQSTQQFQIQISVTITDPENHKGIGSLTVGIDLDLLGLYLEEGGEEARLNNMDIPNE
ncbi:PDC sensor domain-containing protein [Kiloniella majae]|uniref:PDC sensor domain-containing protein n=1 Tax=Kiloniella majae TaxID=1938558 RepID=UPI000A27886E|nr:PDC sensor domain-containing protein [Kiloniella majae]